MHHKVAACVAYYNENVGYCLLIRRHRMLARQQQLASSLVCLLRGAIKEFALPIDQAAL